MSNICFFCVREHDIYISNVKYMIICLTIDVGVDMSKEQVYCEPFCIEEGYQFEIHKVQYELNAPYTCFMHFHAFS